MQGSNRSHRTFFFVNRAALLDAKYGTSNFTSDNIDLYMARSASDTADTVRITANETYAFGYGTNNSPNIANTGIVAGGAVATLDITGAYTVNDPCASTAREPDASPRPYGSSQPSQERPRPRQMYRTP